LNINAISPLRITQEKYCNQHSSRHNANSSISSVRVQQWRSTEDQCRNSNGNENKPEIIHPAASQNKTIARPLSNPNIAIKLPKATNPRCSFFDGTALTAALLHKSRRTLSTGVDQRD
jgi:hypothetical protein